MSGHTELPWRVSKPDGSNYALEVIATNKFGDDELVCRPPGKRRDANAALIVKAVNNHEALLEFFKWAMRDGPWDGGDLDGGIIQDKAESLGLIVKTKYDIAKHGEEHSDFCEGDDFYEFAPGISDCVG